MIGPSTARCAAHCFWNFGAWIPTNGMAFGADLTCGRVALVRVVAYQPTPRTSLVMSWIRSLATVAVALTRRMAAIAALVFSSLRSLARRATTSREHGTRRRTIFLIQTAIGLSCLLVCAGSCGSTSCPHVASACPDDCKSIEASGLDVQRDCSIALATVACRPLPAVSADSIGCAVRLSDGAIFRVLGGAEMHGMAEWRACTEEDHRRADRGAAIGVCAAQ
jgi:hypothetical protein